MHLNLAGKNIDITPALKAHTMDKFTPIEKHYTHVSHINVVLHVEHLSQIAEATLHFNGTEIHAKAESEDMYHSITAVAEKIIGQINKHKEKIIDQHR